MTGRMIDLHCHSHCSDGTLSPQALLERAIHSGVRVLALTDHDTIDGLHLLREAAIGCDIRVINGIELSTRWKKHDIHVIGLNINPNTPDLSVLIEKQNESRIARARQISACLALVGVQNAYEKACDISGHARVGRPHFAQVLMNEKRVSDMQEAFKRFLGRGQSAYVPTNWLSVEAAVGGIVQAGGQAVLAHPLKYKLTRSKLHALIAVFKDAGGRAIEVVSGETTVSQAQDVAGMCLRFDMMASTGSDFHHELSRVGLGRQQALPINCTPVWQHWTID
jgi:3',5'-nucleoside bisphosphate phosphatase